jgi:hypothetical protein
MAASPFCQTIGTASVIAVVDRQLQTPCQRISVERIDAENSTLDVVGTAPTQRAEKIAQNWQAFAAKASQIPRLFSTI